MRVFVSEFVTGGGWPDGSPSYSLAAEGRAMLCAVVEDFARMARVEVETTWDGRLGPAPFRTARIHRTESPQHESSLFQSLAAECDAALVIAPEFDGILRDRCRVVEESGGRLLGPSSSAVETCTDKLRVAGDLHEAGVPTIPTSRLIWDGARLALAVGGAPEFPAVIKPRDGAGSLQVRLVASADELKRVADELGRESKRRELIIQPYVPGRALSVAMIISARGEPTDIFPPAKQNLSDDGRFRYLGGRVPAADVDAEAVQTVVRAACRAVRGLRGYGGIDLILRDGAAARPTVVEINPRLTTSYLGYRELAMSNLAERLLNENRAEPSITWHDCSVDFSPCGIQRAVGRED